MTQRVAFSTALLCVRYRFTKHARFIRIGIIGRQRYSASAFPQSWPCCCRGRESVQSYAGLSNRRCKVHWNKPRQVFDTVEYIARNVYRNPLLVYVFHWGNIAPLLSVYWQYTGNLPGLCQSAVAKPGNVWWSIFNLGELLHLEQTVLSPRSSDGVFSFIDPSCGLYKICFVDTTT